MTDASPSVPACLVGATADDMQRLSERSVLYGACLLVLRPQTRIKPHLQEAVQALLPSVQAYFDQRDDAYAAHAVAYADACSGRAFMEQKAATYRERHPASS